MFISHTYKLLYFEVPRTGSRSVTRALTELDPGSPTAFIRKKRQNLFDYHRYDRGRVEQHPDYCFVAAHRNPYDRLRSHYKFRKFWGNPEGFKSLSFDEYVGWVLHGDHDDRIGHAMRDAPICELIDAELVTHWLAFDTLADDWNALGTRLKVRLPKLPNTNSSSSALDNECVWTRQLADSFYQRFEADFERFGYERESWG